MQKHADFLIRPCAPFAAAAASSEAPKKKCRAKAKEVSTPEEPRDEKAEILARLTPEEKKKLTAVLLLEKLKKKRVRVDGKRTNLYKLGKEIVREQQIEDVGGYEPQIRDRHRWDVNESIPGEQLRPGAFKMQLRPDEEAALPLDLLARGHHFSPHPIVGYTFGGRRDFAFGIYARADEARELLKDKWAGLPRDKVIFNQDFYEDLLDNAHKLELTIMALPVRPLPLQPLRDGFIDRISLGMRQVPGKPLLVTQEPPPDEDLKELQDLRDSFTEDTLSRTGLVDKKGNIVPDSHFIFTALPNADFMAEMITPGRLRDRKSFVAGPFKSARLTRAALSTLLGPFSFDAQAKAQAGQAAVYVINGFKLGLDPSNANQVFADLDNNPVFPEPKVEVIPPETQKFATEEGSPLLLRNIERRREIFGAR
ncbi:g11130 [Coccomyxa elongata]